MSESPLLPVTRLFCASLGFTVARTLPAATSFYSWFTKSGLKMAEHRGYGQSACKMFGLVPAPKLSVPAMALSGVAFLALLILPCLSSTPDAWRAPMLGAALVPYHLYFSQLYCEAHIGAHVTVLVPPALLLLALSPSLDASSANADATAAFTCWLMKIVLTSAYCGAGVCKLTHSLKSLHRGGVPWWSGSTLQAFLFEAMFISNKDTHTSFGVPTPFSYYLQKLHYLNPRTILLPASIGALAFETLAPLLLLAPAAFASIPFALSGLAFHYGIALLQNIDFLSWWGPAYAFLLLDPAAWATGSPAETILSSFTSSSSSPAILSATSFKLHSTFDYVSIDLKSPSCNADHLSLFNSAAAAYDAAPIRSSLAILYVTIHVLAVVILRFFPSVEILPLSSFPMFGAPHNLFDRKSRKWLWLTDKPHATGTLKNYAFPFCRAHTVLVEELPKLPFKYLLYGHGGGEEGKADATLHTNLEMTNELTAALDTITSLGSQEVDTFATDTTVATKLLDALQDAKAAFAKAKRPLTDLPNIGSPQSELLSSNRPPSPSSVFMSSNDDAPASRPIILFDGVCLLCSAFIHFVLDHDKEGRYDFAPLQGPTAKALLTKAGLPLDVSTVVLLDETGVHTRSTAALRVLACCGKPYSLLHSVFIYLPAPIRDAGYKAVAAVRYRLFGKDDGSTCRRMTKAMKQRFHE